MPLPTYVEIAVNQPRISGVFHYHLPPELDGKVGPGSLVVAPFGPQKAQGVVLRMVDVPMVPVTKPVLELIDPQPALTPAQIRLAEWLASETLAPLAACIELFLPPGLSQHAEKVYSLNPQPPEIAAPEIAGSLQQKLLDLIRKRGGSLRSGQIDYALKSDRWRAAAASLVSRGLLQAESILPPPGVRPKLIRTVQLGVPPADAGERLGELGRPNSPAYARRLALLHFLMREPWPVETAWAYAQSGATLADLQHLAAVGLVSLGESEMWRDPLASYEPVLEDAPPLTPDQELAWQPLKAAIEAAACGDPVPPFLLHGVTGSGKTELYLRAAAHTLRLGRQAVVLVPEISLTPQIVRRFIGRFPGQVGLVHSNLSAGERYDTWRRCRAGLLPLVVGPRSALFAPLARLGLVVVDESHDDSYYQDDPQPFYHAASAARAYARLSGAVCLLGTATPDVVTLYSARQENWTQASLPQRVPAAVKTGALTGSTAASPEAAGASALALPQISIVDMRSELKHGNRSIFSTALQDALKQTLAAGQQAILFLNRRGTATYVFCAECGHSLRCPNCDIPLTYHANPAGLVCHYCGYQRKMPARCPECHSASMRQYGTGTEKVEAEVKALLPAARTLRWDAETTRQKGAHEIILSHFSAHRADVLVGTQMLAKGLDLPLVTLVGAVLADVGLNLPDYRAGERTYQILTQVAGRAGRSSLGGQAILQTFMPAQYAIQAAARQDYEAFYRQELEYRKTLRYPPYYRLVRLEYRHARPEQAAEAAARLADSLRAWIADGDFRATSFIGPAPCFFGQLQGMHRWQIILRGPNPSALLRGRELPGWRIEVDPPSLL